MATKEKKIKAPEPERAHPLNAANPQASRAGSEHTLESDGLPVRIKVIDGARAVIEIDKHDPLTQADLQGVGKLIDAAVQGTY